MGNLRHLGEPFSEPLAQHLWLLQEVIELVLDLLHAFVHLASVLVVHADVLLGVWLQTAGADAVLLLGGVHVAVHQGHDVHAGRAVAALLAAAGPDLRLLFLAVLGGVWDLVDLGGGNIERHALVDAALVGAAAAVAVLRCGGLGSGGWRGHVHRALREGLWQVLHQRRVRCCGEEGGDIAEAIVMVANVCCLWRHDELIDCWFGCWLDWGGC
mmetsp:Transcript_9308/g.25240  ORF Transcript_9308/g.25240 Transcript_9308/m.25240 type:complete len:213 (-) Transcript_9308:40-678(-)